MRHLKIDARHWGPPSRASVCIGRPTIIKLTQPDKWAGKNLSNWPFNRPFDKISLSPFTPFIQSNHLWNAQTGTSFFCDLALLRVGALNGGSWSRVSRNGNVACLCRLKFPMSLVEFKKWPCPMSLWLSCPCRVKFKKPQCRPVT